MNTIEEFIDDINTLPLFKEYEYVCTTAPMVLIVSHQGNDEFDVYTEVSNNKHIRLLYKRKLPTIILFFQSILHQGNVTLIRGN